MGLRILKIPVYTAIRRIGMTALSKVDSGEPWQSQSIWIRAPFWDMFKKKLTGKLHCFAEFP